VTEAALQPGWCWWWMEETSCRRSWWTGWRTV